MEDLRPIREQICSFIQNKQNAYLSSVASDLALCMILNITYFQMSKEDLCQLSSSDLSKQPSEFCDREAASSVTSGKMRDK